MTHTAAQKQASKTDSSKSPEPSAGPRGIALAPPDYGIDVIDAGALGAVPAGSGPGPAIQAKMTLGPPNDTYEQEADRVAKQVVRRLNAPEAGRTYGESQGESPPKPTVQRETLPGDGDELRLKLTPLTGAAIEGGDVSPDLVSAIEHVRGGGQPLDADLRQAMGQAMKADFRGVRIHADGLAHTLNRAISAKAFTTGQDVFFRQSAYQPGNREGQELIAHELAHVTQQSRKGPPEGDREAAGALIQRVTLYGHEADKEDGRKQLAEYYRGRQAEGRKRFRKLLQEKIESDPENGGLKLLANALGQIDQEGEGGNPGGRDAGRAPAPAGERARKQVEPEARGHAEEAVAAGGNTGTARAEPEVEKRTVAEGPEQAREQSKTKVSEYFSAQKPVKETEVEIRSSDDWDDVELSEYIFHKALANMIQKAEGGDKTVNAILSVLKHAMNLPASNAPLTLSYVNAKGFVDPVSTRFSAGSATTASAKVASGMGNKEQNWKSYLEWKKNAKDRDRDQVEERVLQVSTTMMHEATHVVLHKMFEYGSLPYFNSVLLNDGDFESENKRKAKLKIKTVSDKETLISEFTTPTPESVLANLDHSQRNIWVELGDALKTYRDEGFSELLSHVVELYLGWGSNEELMKKCVPNCWQLVQEVVVKESADWLKKEKEEAVTSKKT